jgi:hypothetical protein
VADTGSTDRVRGTCSVNSEELLRVVRALLARVRLVTRPPVVALVALEAEFDRGLVVLGVFGAVVVVAMTEEVSPACRSSSSNRSRSLRPGLGCQYQLPDRSNCRQCLR